MSTQPFVRKEHRIRAEGRRELVDKMNQFEAAVRARAGRVLAIEWEGGIERQVARIVYSIPLPVFAVGA